MNIDKFDFVVDSTGKASLYQQIGGHVASLITGGKLESGEKLPPVRKLAEKLGVNNGTVVSAYRWLENKKLIYSIMGSGSYVSEVSPGDVKEAKTVKPREVRFNSENAINFATSVVPADFFPIDSFKRYFNEVLDSDGGNAFGYQESQGYLPLREAICGYCAEFGVQSLPDRIQIISGAQQGVDIISKAVLSPGDVILCEELTYPGAVGAFLSRGAKVIGVPLEFDGMDINHLTSLVRLYRPKIVYCMSYWQTPTGLTYSLRKKRMLVELAAQYDFLIIEEDNVSDFSYSNEKIAPIKALDYKNRVIFIKSFSNIFMPGLRLGFMVLPRAVSERVADAKYTADIETSGFIQRAFCRFIASGEWKQHVAKIRGVYSERHDAMKAFSEKLLKSHLSFQAPGGGLCFWYTLQSAAQADELCSRMLSENIIITPGSIFTLNDEPSAGIRLSFASVDKNSIKVGIEAMSREILSIV